MKFKSTGLGSSCKNGGRALRNFVCESGALYEGPVRAERVVELRQQNHVRPRDGRRVEQAGNLHSEHCPLSQTLDSLASVIVLV